MLQSTRILLAGRVPSQVFSKPDLGVYYLEPTFDSRRVDVQIGELLVTKGAK